MREIIQNERSTEYTDGGFTLVEVIIAVVIMAIAAIPILHAFSTTANTSSKALIKMRATNAAENIMEDIKGMSLDEVVKKYGDVSNPKVTEPNFAGLNTTSDPYIPKKDDAGVDILGGYEFKIDSSDPKLNADINDVLDKGYKATIQLDPTYYPNINSVNMSDFDEVSSAHSAIVSVDGTMDEQAVKKFVDLNKGLETHLLRSEDEIRGAIKREIRIEVTKQGTVTESVSGEDIDNVEVTATVSYLAYNNTIEKYVPTGTEIQKLLNRKVFSNTSNGNRLNSVFVLYQPLYANAKYPSDSGDIIIIHNRDSIEFNLFIVAQNTATADWENYRKSAGAGLILEIYEDKVKDTSKNDDSAKKEPITLYTNLHDDVEYTRKEDSELIPVQCYINLDEAFRDPEGINDVFEDKVYKRIINKVNATSFENKAATLALNARDIDGKNLDASKVDDKIYDVIVTVEKTPDDPDTEWPISVTLSGTMVDDKSMND